MKVPYNWLKQYVELNIDAAELARRFTFAGLEVEEVSELAAEIEGVVIARVLEAAPHPLSDHISVCRVDGGDREYTILCGAPNVAVGQTVPLAKIGARLPGGIEIAAKPALGMTSEGMICSKAELGIDKHDQAGIWVLPQGLEIGADLVAALELRDTVLDIALTPNRSDCLGLLNCAYEAAALFGGSVKEPALDYTEDGPPIEDLLQITVEDSALCPRYVGRLVQGLKIGPSPLWMQNFLLAAGMRPINNVVDISNFVMLEMNQPLHTFDYQQLAGRRINVRAAQAGETMQTLDAKEREFIGGEILICDGEKAVCIGGIMGGMNSEVTEATTDVLIEAACFNFTKIRQTARRLGIPSEASQRFEKGIDIANCDRAARRAAQLMVKYCGATAAKGLLDIGGQAAYAPRQITLRQARVNDLLGTAYSMEEIIGVMRCLSFVVKQGEQGVLLVSIPSYRQDITLEEDLVEEVARLIGYDVIPATLPASAAEGSLNEKQRQRARLRELNVALGLSETVNYSFISPKEADKLLLPKEHYLRRPLVVANPLTEEQSVMRLSLLPGLLNCARRNISRRNLDLALFELGSVYVPAEISAATAQPQEIPSWGLLLAGSAPASWQGAGRAYDYFYAKGIIENVAAAFNISGLSFMPDDEGKFDPCYLHPGRRATIFVDGQRLGIIGELHPLVADNYELPPGLAIAEMNLQRFFSLVQPPSVQGLPKYPAVERDLALVGADTIAAADIAAAISNAGGPLLTQVKLFDLYDAPPIPAGQRSLAYALSFRDEERTLTDAEVDAAVKNIINSLETAYGLKLR